MSNVLPAGTPAPDFTLRVTPDQFLSLPAGRAGHPRLLSRGLEPGLRRSDDLVQRGASGVSQASRRAVGHLGRWRVVSRSLRQGSPPAFSLAGGFSPEGRGREIIPCVS